MVRPSFWRRIRRVISQAGQILVAELGPTLRQITGRKRTRAWTIG
jgi:hypothetical protein